MGNAAAHQALQLALLQLVASFPSDVQTLRISFHVAGSSLGHASLLIGGNSWLKLAKVLHSHFFSLKLVEFVLVATAKDSRMGFEGWQWADECIAYVQDIFSSLPGQFCFLSQWSKSDLTG